MWTARTGYEEDFLHRGGAREMEGRGAEII